MTMTPDEVVERLNKLCKRSCGGSVKLCISENEAEALLSAISLLQDYQKLREKVNKIKNIVNDNFVWGKEGLTQAIVTYLQQPTEH